MAHRDQVRAQSNAQRSVDLLKSFPVDVAGDVDTRDFRSQRFSPVENIAAFAKGKPIRVLTAERNDSRLVRI